MKFTVQSSELNNVLQAAGKIINPKHPLPIMEYMVFVADDNMLEITASDQETTQITKIPVTSLEQRGSVAVPSRLMLDFIKEFSDQPITMESNPDTYEITVDWSTGSIVLPGQSVEGYPDVKSKNSDTLKRAEMSTQKLADLISLTNFATADKDSRPTMMGILFDFYPECTNVVATDAHKLVRVTLTEDKNDIAEPSSFILNKRPALMLRSLLAKENETVVIEYDSKSIHFTMENSIFICRAIEGRFPNYNSVIPSNNDKVIIVDRLSLLSAIKRVSVCSDKSSNMVKMTISDSQIRMQARDTNFYVNAEDTIICSYSGETIEIGFKYMHLIEMLSAFSSTNVEIALFDATRPGLFTPLDSENECEKNCLVLLMPIM